MYNAKLKELQQRNQSNQSVKTENQTTVQTAKDIEQPDTVEKSTPDRSNRSTSRSSASRSSTSKATTKKKLTVVETTSDKS